MTRKDYIRIAKALREVLCDLERTHQSRASFEALYCAIAGTLVRDNPRFDHERFRAAVYEGTVIARPGATPRPLETA